MGTSGNDFMHHGKVRWLLHSSVISRNLCTCIAVLVVKLYSWLAE